MPLTCKVVSTVSCEEFNQYAYHREDFAERITGAYKEMDIGVPVLLSIESCNRSEIAYWAERRGLQDDGVPQLINYYVNTITTKVKSNTMHAMRKLAKAHDDGVRGTFVDVFNGFMTRPADNSTENNTTSAHPLSKTVFIELQSATASFNDHWYYPPGVATMIIDSSELASYPASMFKDPTKEAGAALVGFVGEWCVGVEVGVW
jgi:hypothetical protein